MFKTLKCKTCGEEVRVPDCWLSVVCTDCAEASLAEKEYQEQLADSPTAFGEQLHAHLAKVDFRKGYLHQRAMEKALKRI